jgi:hypothetical protein
VVFAIVIAIYVAFVAELVMRLWQSLP